MRFSFFILSIPVFMAACNPNSKTSEGQTVQTNDTTIVTKPETLAPEKQEAAASEKKKTTTRETTTSETTTMNSESENTAESKKGWSNTAKGAVIGGVVGAGTGAVVNKKNRAAGAVIGGVVGAGTGAIIGNEMDKKDGRH
jgi:hypothetical protein